jgi:hypothetical protein
MFWKLDLFPSSGKARETPVLLGRLERANLNHWTASRLSTCYISVMQTTQSLHGSLPFFYSLENREYGRRDLSH